MNNKVLTALLAPALTAGLSAPALAGSTLHSVGIGSANIAYFCLYAGAKWQRIMVPVSDLGGTVPSNLRLVTSGLPAGIAISMYGMSQNGDTLMLKVETKRVDKTVSVNTNAHFSLMSGDNELANFDLPVVGVGAPMGSVTP